MPSHNTMLAWPGLLITAAFSLPSPALADDDSSAPVEITVAARRLDAAREAIDPALGANVATITREVIARMPGGSDRDIGSVLLQMPGVTQDTSGDAEFHLRNEHGNVQYRINGISVPEGFAGFGPLVDTRIADSIQLITGALPAQYGFQTSGIVKINTSSKTFAPGGDLGIYGGSNGTIQPSATYRNSLGRLNMFLSASYLRSDLGIANPTPERRALHDRTEQYRAFGYFSYVLDDTSRLSLFGGSNVGSFQIPVRGNQTPDFTLLGRSAFDPLLLDQNQHSKTHFGVLAYQYSGDAFDIQIAPYLRWSQAHFQPDPAGGELMFNGADTDLDETALAYGVQADASLKLGDRHTLRFGMTYQYERHVNHSINRVFPVDATGAQSSETPLTIPVNQRAAARSIGGYVQDEWLLGEQLTFNFGLRYDHYRGDTSDGQISPRANLVWTPAPGTSLHLGYARNFTPPPLALIGKGDLLAFDGTTGEAEVTLADPIRAEREHLLDLGLQQAIGSHVTLAIDGYYKWKRNLLDSTQFGATELFAPFNYEHARGWGIEFAAAYGNGPFDAYLNVARGEQKARHIISNQFFFGAQELDYITANDIFVDHSQAWTVSAGASLRLANRLGELQPSIELIHGSGLRAGDPNGIVPNGGTEESYVQVNFGLSQRIGIEKNKAWTLRFDVTNLFDRVYLAHEGSGVGAGQPQYGPRRAFHFGLRKAF